MDKIESVKYEKISDIVSVVKMLALLFTTIIFFKTFLNYDKNGDIYIDSEYTLISLGGAIFLFFLVYAIWAFSNKRKNQCLKNKSIRYVEDAIFILIFVAAIIFSGGYQSSYKLLFLFIITTSTIQSGIKEGMTMAFISSGIILTMDLLGLRGAEINIYFENDLILCGIFILTAWTLGYYVKIARDHIKSLQEMANKDGLTSLYNHRYFYEFLDEALKKAKSENQPISMIFTDIDFFKVYNDCNGHQMGDKVLKNVASILASNTKGLGIAARYGGEEFAIVLPNICEKRAIEIAEKIRNEVANKYFEFQENQPNGNLTISLGVSAYPDKASNETDLIKSADDALYRAKFFRKNRVESYTSILDELKRDIHEKDVDLITSLKTLISVINAKDRYTYAHTERVVMYARLMAEKLNLSEEEKKTLIYGAYMHDIGKINIPKEVLDKKMPLTKDEWETLKRHPQIGVEIIEPVECLCKTIPLILHHHEKYDGTGYPNGLSGEEIPFLARVLTVIDSFDAMTSDRPYNRRKSYEEGIKELKKCSGIQFDPFIAHKFSKVIEENKCKIENAFN